MEEGRNYRAINILTALLGAAACIGAYFVPAPEGLLADESISMFKAIAPGDMPVMFAVPSLLIVLAAILVLTGKPRILAVLAAIAGGALFVWTDVGYAMSGRACSGTLINVIGVILIIAAALLQAFGTPSAKQIVWEEERNIEKAKEHEDLQSEIFFEDEPEDYETAFSYDLEDDGIDLSALKTITKELEEAVPAGDEPSSDNTDIDDIAALLKREISEEAANVKPAAPPAVIQAEEKDIAEFYQGLEEMFLDDSETEGEK